jgi:gas vesicle protein GvpL/GvpF
MSDSAATRDLQGAIEALAAEMVPAVVADARSEAEANARAILAKEITRALLREAEGVLEAPGSQEPPREVESPTAAREPAPPHASERADEPALGLYLYGIVRANVRISGELPGVDRRNNVFLLAGSELAAIVSSVPLEEFGEEPLRENLNEVAWLEEKARAHEGVLEVLLESTTVVPTRLCTIFSDEKQVREMMSRERAPLLEALERLEGKAEWGAKAFAEPGALERAALERVEEGADDEPVSPGAAYMDRRRREARARENAEEIADGWAQAIHERLARCAAEALLNPLQRREVSGRDGDMLLNGVYLVEDREMERFRELAFELGEEYRARGVAVELTGPWPAYNFVKNSIEAAR